MHLTLDLGGQAKFGPDIRWINAIDDTFDDSLKPGFVVPYAPICLPSTRASWFLTTLEEDRKSRGRQSLPPIFASTASGVMVSRGW
ncbi:MAG: hypothetical protein V2I44_14695 [Erythrobacter sp.]|nr:hypothetical protein [Erythrobacter sp.]